MISHSNTFISVDVETYSSYDIAKTGVYHYVEAPDFDILLISYAINGGPVKVLDMTEDVKTSDQLELYEPHHRDDDTEFKKYLFDPNVTKYAFNANFERTCLAKYYGRPMPPEEWRCTMVMAHACGIPGTLGTVGAILGLPQDKRKDMIGKRLISYFCKPCAPSRTNGGRTRNLPQHDPEKWKLFKEYNRQDVVAEMAIAEKIRELGAVAMTAEEWHLWAVDQHQNDNGVMLDMPMVNKIVEYDTQRSAELLEESKRLTGLDNPQSLQQLRKWLSAKGYPMKQITKDTLSDALKQDLPDDVRRVLEIRQALGKTSVTKYRAMQSAVCDDSRLRGILQFYGAGRTGRWAGRIVQTHNLARNTLPDLDVARQLAETGDFDTMELLYGETAFVFSELIRTAFIPSPGCRFIVSDFSAIEARVIAWLAGQMDTVQAFKDGKDIYCETASRMYGVPVVKHGINGHLRQRGKVATLACGYGGGKAAMQRMDITHSIPEEELEKNVEQWREANPRIVEMWHKLEVAAIYALKFGQPASFSRDNGPKVTFWRNTRKRDDGNVVRDLCVTLPSGRCLVYADAQLSENRWGKDEITYMGSDRKEGYQVRVGTYGGKLTENIVQAIARDCLGWVMEEVYAMGYKIVMHVHDEIIVDVPKADTEAPQKILAAMHFTDDHCPEWAKGLPLKGDMYEADYYKKD
jgi:DNA polymerase